MKTLKSPDDNLRGQKEKTLREEANPDENEKESPATSLHDVGLTSHPGDINVREF
jgi:hypothetical protein